ncbi:MAG: hypothetical protein PHX30_05355 [Candidatus Pacebacteria bacterium]|jgi:hypothetical protein|nr:hypothetical protein [Candidatus Paceibacterota bacterium]
MEENISSEERNAPAGREIGAGEGKNDNFSVQKKDRLKKAMKQTRFWLLFFAILLVWMGVMQYFVAEKYRAFVKIVGEGEEVSANATTDGLDFGILPRGNSSTRFITINNQGERDIYVKIYKWGEIGKFIETNRNDFVLEAGKGENLEFMLEVPSGAEEKEYGGKVVIFEIPKIL